MNAFETISQLLNGKKRTEAEELVESHNALHESLTNDQMVQLVGAGSFWVLAKDQKRYLIRFKDGMIKEERSANLWYLRIHGVNAYDEMAIKKAWLENAPEEILAAAKKLRLETGTEKVIDWRLVKMTGGSVRVPDDQSVTIASDWNAEEAANYIRRHLELKLKEPVHVWLQKNQFAGDLEVHVETADHKAAYMVSMVQLAQTQYPGGIWCAAVEYLYRMLEIEREKAFKQSQGPMTASEVIAKINMVSNKASPIHWTNLRAKSERLKKAVDRMNKK